MRGDCDAVGRDINQINISEQLLVCIGASDTEVEEKWKIAQRLPFWRTGIKGTPPQIIATLNTAINEVLADPEVKRRLLELGVDSRGSTPLEMDAQLRDDVKKWVEVIDKAGIEKH